MRKNAHTKSILACAMMFGLSMVGMAQDQNTTNSNSNNNSSQTKQSSPNSTTTSSTADQAQTPTDTSSQQTRSRTTDQQSTSTDQTGNTNTTTSKSTDTATGSSRNRTMDTDKSMIGERDRRFLTKAAEGGLMEVQMAQTAQQKASSQAVKDYAKQLEQDHSNANKQLTDIATQRNVSLPTTPVTGDHQQAMDKLGKLSGADFDKQYIKMMIKDHKKDIKEFENESNNGMDSSLKAFASSTLPTLRNHLQMAEQIDRGGSATPNKTTTSSTSSTTTTNDAEGTRSRSTGVVEDKSTINKVTPAPSDTSTTQVDRTTTNSDGSVKEDKTTINKTTTKP